MYTFNAYGCHYLAKCFNPEKIGRECRKKLETEKAPKEFPEDNIFNNMKINMRELKVQMTVRVFLRCVSSF